MSTLTKQFQFVSKPTPLGLGQFENWDHIADKMSLRARLRVPHFSRLCCEARHLPMD